MLSRCWMLTVVITSMPASRSSSTSSQRFSWRPEPGTLVWASSSTSATFGVAGRARRRGPSPRTSSRGTRPTLRGTTSRPSIMLLGLGPAVGLDEADRRRRCPARCAAPALVEHGVGLADAGGGAEVDPEVAGRLDRRRSALGPDPAPRPCSPIDGCPCPSAGAARSAVEAVQRVPHRQVARRSILRRPLDDDTGHRPTSPGHAHVGRGRPGRSDRSPSVEHASEAEVSSPVPRPQLRRHDRPG